MQRPTSVTVFAILNLVFAALGVFGLIGSLTLLTTVNAGNNPVVKIMQDNPGYKTWIMASIPLGLAACIVLLASGIGLLSLKPWARWLAIGYAIYGILSCIIGMVLNYMFLVRPLLEQAQRARGPEAAALAGGAVGGVIGGCLGLIYPFVLLFFMLHPKVAAAFRRENAQDDSYLDRNIIPPR